MPHSDDWNFETADCDPQCRPTYVTDLASPEKWSAQLPSRKYDVVDFSMGRPRKRVVLPVSYGERGIRQELLEDARLACHALRSDGLGYVLFSARTLADLAHLGPHRRRTAASWTNYHPRDVGTVTQQEETDGAARAVAEITGRRLTCERACACSQQEPTMLLVHAPLAACPAHVHDYIRCRDAAASSFCSCWAPTIAFRVLPRRDAQATLDADKELYLKAREGHERYISDLHSAVDGADSERLSTLLLEKPHTEISEGEWGDLLEAGVRNAKRDMRFVKTLCSLMKVDRHALPAGEAVDACLEGAFDAEDHRCAFVDSAAYICAFFYIDDLAYYIERWKLPDSEVRELRRRIRMYSTTQKM